MQAQDFLIEGPADLTVFLDFLVDLDHPGQKTVRRMIREGKFPSYHQEWDDHKWRGGNWGWWFTREPNMRSHDDIYLPDEDNGWRGYQTITDAVWALIELSY